MLHHTTVSFGNKGYITLYSTLIIKSTPHYTQYVLQIHVHATTNVGASIQNARAIVRTCQSRAPCRSAAAWRWRARPSRGPGLSGRP